MPYLSHYEQISKIAALISFLTPRSVLDIGAGKGKYGSLVREFGSVKVIVDAIEAYGPYAREIPKEVYRDISHEDVVNIIDKLFLPYDVVLLIDVLDKLKQEDGDKLLRKIIGDNVGVIISVPKWLGKSETDNPYDKPKYKWSLAKLKRFSPHYYVIDDPVSHIIYLGDVNSVRKVRRQHWTNRAKYFLGSIPPLNWLYRTLYWKPRYGLNSD